MHCKRCLDDEQAVRLALMSHEAVGHGWTFSHNCLDDSAGRKNCLGVLSGNWTWLERSDIILAQTGRILLSLHELLGVPP